MNNEDVIGRIVIAGVSRAEKEEAKRVFDYFVKKFNNDSKKIHQEIRKNVVNSPYSKASNDYVTYMWDLYKKRFPS